MSNELNNQNELHLSVDGINTFLKNEEMDAKTCIITMKAFLSELEEIIDRPLPDGGFLPSTPSQVRTLLKKTIHEKNSTIQTLCKQHGFKDSISPK